MNEDKGYELRVPRCDEVMHVSTYETRTESCVRSRMDSSCDIEDSDIGYHDVDIAL